MRRRRIGRPRTAQMAMNKALEHLGGLKEVVQRMDTEGKTYQFIADELRRLTGITVHLSTIPKWLHEWHSHEIAEVKEVIPA